MRAPTILAFIPALSLGAAIADPYIDTVLHHHNIHRANHSAPALTWNSDLEASARELAQSCLWGHNTAIGGGGYGQNIAAGYADVAQALTNGFYNSEVPFYEGQYGKPTPDTTMAVGHFTQLVWSGTQSVGCATADCNLSDGGMHDAASGQVVPGLQHYTVCNYYPPGNYLGSYAENVHEPKGMATVTA